MDTYLEIMKKILNHGNELMASQTKLRCPIDRLKTIQPFNKTSPKVKDELKMLKDQDFIIFHRENQLPWSK